MSDADATFDRLSALLHGAPRTPGAWSAFAAAAKATGRVAEATRLCIRMYDADPTLWRALEALLNLVPDEPQAGCTVAVVPESARRSISVVTCSRDDARFAAMAASYERALADWPHEIVRIADAASLAEGYDRGSVRAAGEIIVFSHDDVEILPPDLGHRLLRHLGECDILGVAGSTRATGPAWPWAGWPYLHGAVVYPDGDGYRVSVYGRTAPLARGIRVMDGVFLAMDRAATLRVGWDREACEGFHGYDVDFTLRAAQAGLRLAAASDLGLVHRSSGSFDERWEVAARKLMARHPELNGECARETGPVVRRVPDAARALALLDNWVRMARAG